MRQHQFHLMGIDFADRINSNETRRSAKSTWPVCLWFVPARATSLQRVPRDQASFCRDSNSNHVQFDSLRLLTTNVKRLEPKKDWEKNGGWPLDVTECIHVPLIQSDDTWKFRELPRKFTSLAVTPGIDSKDMSLCFYVRDFYDGRFVHPSWHHAVRVPMPAVSSDSALNYPDNCQSIVDSNTNWIKYRKCKYWIIRPKHPKSNTSRIPGIDC